MQTFDFTPLFRSTVGFDRLTRLLDSRIDDGAFSYPPYNIEQTGEDAYRIVMAVAGFGEGDLSVTQQGNALLISGKQEKPAEEKKYLYRGIAGRAFERRDDHPGVWSGQYELQNAVLEIPGLATPVRFANVSVEIKDGLIWMNRIHADRAGARAPGGHEAPRDQDRR